MEKNQRRSVWITDSLYDRIKKAAALDGRSVANWIRAILAKALDNENRRV